MTIPVDDLGNVGVFDVIDGLVWKPKHPLTLDFLAVQNSSIGDLVPWLLALSDTTNNQSLHNTTE